MRLRLLLARCAGGTAAACYLIWSSGARAVDHPDLFAVTSPDFPDNGLLAEANAGAGTSLRGPWACGGQNTSPALAWSQAPTETQSFAVIMDGPYAARGRGGNHWIMYDIPPSAHGAARGAAGQPRQFFRRHSFTDATHPGPAPQ